MRLTCPACGATYEAPDAAFPEHGRWVRCHVCRAEWMARPPAPAGVEPSGPAAPAPAAGPAASPPRAPSLVAPASASLAPSLVAPARPAATVDPARAAGPPSLSAAPPDHAPAAQPSAPVRPSVPARPSAPAQEDKASDRGLARSLEAGDGDGAEAGRSGGRVMSVAALIGFAALIAVLAYARQDAISAAAPGLAEPLAAYAAWVDRLRAALAGLLSPSGV